MRVLYFGLALLLAAIAGAVLANTHDSSELAGAASVAHDVN